jgi:hypothetical protein
MNQSNFQVMESQERSMTRLSRTYIAQIDALKKYRSKAQQTVRVERVTVNEGGQAIVGDVTHGGGGLMTKNDTNPRPYQAPQKRAQMHGHCQADRAELPIPCRAWLEGLPRSRCWRWRASRPNASQLSAWFTNEGDANRAADNFFSLQRCQRDRLKGRTKLLCDLSTEYSNCRNGTWAFAAFAPMADL